MLDGMAAEFGKSRNTIRMWLMELAQQGLEVQRPYSNKYGVREVARKSDPPKSVDYFDKAWNEYRELIGMSKKHKPPKPRLSKVGRRRKIVAISDIHGNPHLPGIKAALDEKPDLMLLVGDIYDNFALSRFDNGKNIPIEVEMASIRALAEMISGVCPSKWASGNHDRRCFTYFTRRVAPEFMQLVHTDMIGMGLVGLENCTVVNNLHGFTTAGGVCYDRVLNDIFMIFEGDAVFAHSETSRKGELNTVRGLREWYLRWRPSLGLPEPILLAQAHIHRAGIGYPNGGHAIDVEMGCMLSPETIGYALGGDTKYSPPTHGYLVVEQDRIGDTWKTILSSVRFVLC